LPHLSATTRAAATICSSQKTLAFGIPFIKTAFGHKSNVANILTPLLIYSPIQLFLGSLVVVQFAKKRIEQEEKAKA
jgi:predicted Na+-dependent transporter